MSHYPYENFWLEVFKQSNQNVRDFIINLPSGDVTQSFPLFHIDVNSHNSGNPSLERHILKEASYGRQLDKISDALNYLITHNQNAELKEQDKIKPFLEQYHKINDIKQAFKFSTQSFENQLDHLKKYHPEHLDLIQKIQNKIHELDKKLKL